MLFGSWDVRQLPLIVSDKCSGQKAVCRWNAKSGQMKKGLTEEVSRDLPVLSNNDSSLGIGLLENSKPVLPICLPVVLGASFGG